MESMDSNWEWYEKRDDTDGWYHSDVLSCADTSSFVWTQKLEVWWIFLWLAPINILEFLVRWHYALKIVSWIITFFLYVTCHHHTFTPHSQWVGPFLPSERPQIFVEWIQKIAGNIPQILVAAISHHTVAESLHHILEVHGANPYVTTDTR